MPSLWEKEGNIHSFSREVLYHYVNTVLYYGVQCTTIKPFAALNSGRLSIVY